MTRRLLLPLLAALAGLPITSLAMAQRPEPYAIKTLADGTVYLGSDVFILRRGPDLSQHLLDQALEISDTAVRHVPTGLSLPRVHGDCTLAWMSGLPVPGTQFQSYERGGRAYYACDSVAPSFVIVTFEADMPGFGNRPGDPGRSLLAAGMVLQRDPDRFECEDRIEGDVRRLSCRTQSSWNGQTVHEAGLFFGASDTFLKLNVACLEAHCEGAIATMEQLGTAMGGDALTADARTD